jgi:hypothetical protein
MKKLKNDRLNTSPEGAIAKYVSQKLVNCLQLPSRLFPTKITLKELHRAVSFIRLSKDTYFLLLRALEVYTPYKFQLNKGVITFYNSPRKKEKGGDRCAITRKKV